MRISRVLAIPCALLLAVSGCSRSPAADPAPQEPSLADGADAVPAPAPTPQPADSIAQVAAAGSLLDTLLGGYSAKSFGAGAVDADDLTRILEAGIRAPSARNLQPWHFSVVQDPDKVGRYVQQAGEGNALIVVSGATAETQGMDVSLDCGLATENLYIAAQALGYGAHIYMAPVSSMNESREELGIPDGYDALVAVLVGPPGDGDDAVTGASARNAFADMVTYAD